MIEEECEAHLRGELEVILNYEGSEYVIPSIYLNKMVKDIENYSAKRIFKKTFEIDSTKLDVKIKICGSEPEKADSKYKMLFVAYLLKTGALDDYKQG